MVAPARPCTVFAGNYRKLRQRRPAVTEPRPWLEMDAVDSADSVDEADATQNDVDAVDAAVDSGG